MFSINFKLQNNDSLYSQGRGYGFFTPEMAVTSSGTAHEQSLKSGGWNTRHFYEEVSDAADHKYELYDYAPEYYYFLDYLYSIFDDT